MFNKHFRVLKVHDTLSPAYVDDDDDAYTDFFQALSNKDETLSFEFETLEAIIRQNSLSITETNEIIHYFKSYQTMDALHSTSLFNVAVEIVIATQRIWRLNRASLEFFQTLKITSPTQFNLLLRNLGKLCDPNDRALFLKAHHIDMVISSLQKQMQMPPHSLKILSDYLDIYHPDIVPILDALRPQNQLKIETQAAKYHLSHHNAIHALRIKTHAMSLINAQFFLEDTKSNVFLQNIVAFAIEHHDYEQKDKGRHTSVEEATASYLTDCLSDALNLQQKDSCFMSLFCCKKSTTPHAPVVHNILDLLNAFIVKLGTTTIFAARKTDEFEEQKQTMDLSELFLLIESSAIMAGLSVGNDTNTPLFKILKAIMLITGICDKNPAALYDVVAMQSNNATLTMIKTCIDAPLLLEDFFSSPSFKPYFLHASDKINQQAFLLGLTPHLRMRAELSVGNPNEGPAEKQMISAAAIQLTTFIAICDKKFLSISESAPDMTWFDEALDEFGQHNMQHVFNLLFFSSTEQETCGLEKESQFCESQFKTLSFAHEALIKLGQPQNIEPTVPYTDAHNVQALAIFYINLTSDRQREALIKELLLSIIYNPVPIMANKLNFEIEPTLIRMIS